MSHPKRMFDPSGERKLWAPDSEEAKALPHTGCVYRITLDGKISVAVPAGDKRLPGPNGVTVTKLKDGGEGLIMGDFFTGNIVQYQNGKLRVLAKGMRGADAVAVGKGVIYVSSWTDGKVWKYESSRPPSGR